MDLDMVEARTQGSGPEPLLSGATLCASRALSFSDSLRQRLAPEPPVVLRDDDVSRVAAFALSIGEQLFSHFADAVPSFDHDAAVRALILGDDQLLQVLFARAIEHRLCRNGKVIGLFTPELPTRMADLVEGVRHPAAEAAMALVVSQSRFLGNAMAFRLDLTELPAELIAALVRRTVVFLQDLPGGDVEALGNAGEAMLSGYDESTARGYRIARFCHEASWPTSAENWSIAETGPALCLAMLARHVGCSADYLFPMTIDPALERLAVVVKASSQPAETALRFIVDVAALAGTAIEGLPDYAQYEAMTVSEARALVTRWRNQWLAETNLYLPPPNWGAS